VAEQTATQAIHGVGAQPAGNGGEHAGHHGRASSWVAVAIIVTGFVVGGVSMFISPIPWWLFWTGAGIVVIGGIMALSTRILDDWY
jgi:protein-S-isoprenylcysteine O-methyltransferase Ste14